MATETPNQGSSKEPKLTNLSLNLPPDVVITGCTTHPYADEIHVRFSSAVPKCPRCESEHHHVRSSPKLQTVHHTPRNGRPTFISGEKSRYAYCHCKKTFYVTPRLLHPTLRMTTVLFNSIASNLMEGKTLAQIANDNGTA